MLDKKEYFICPQLIKRKITAWAQFSLKVNMQPPDWKGVFLVPLDKLLFLQEEDKLPVMGTSDTKRQAELDLF
jgi:hypothetical protein